MGHRKRIDNKKAEAGVVVDPLEYIANLSTPLARHIESVVKRSEFKLWIDKHYKNRAQFGDEDGPREGIDQDCVISLVKESIHHLIYYSSQIIGFTFVTNEDSVDRAIRVVLQKEENGVKLNVVIETHHHAVDDYEITVVTAKKINGFGLSDGQYAIELIDGGSELRKLIKGNVQDISNI